LNEIPTVTLQGKVTKTERVSAIVEPKELVYALLHLCGLPGNVLFSEELGFYTCEDVSYHGSPVYKNYPKKPKEGAEILAQKTLELRAELIKAGFAHPLQF
jgi:hypothetical protein